MNTTINRRQLMQRMTALALGTIAAPLSGWADKRNQINDPADFIYIAPGEGKKGKVGDMKITFKLESDQTVNHLGSWESIIQPGELGAPPHLHNNIDEVCRVLEGSVFILTGDTVTEVKAGGWHLRPKGIVHTFWNSGKIPARTIDICLPGGHEKYMQELAALFENGHRPQPGDMKTLEAKHDIHYRYDLLEGIVKKYKVKL